MRSHGSPGSPASSPPPRKKQRLSSPTYDSLYDLSQEQLDAFDEYDRRMSGSVASPSKSSQFLYGNAAGRYERGLAASMGLKDLGSTEEGDDPFGPPGSPTMEIARLRENREGGKEVRDPSSNPSNPFTPTAAFLGDNFSPPGLGGVGFISALQAQVDIPNSPPVPTASAASSDVHPEQEQDIDSWFSSTIPANAQGFAASLVRDTDEDWFRSGAKPPVFGGFQSAKVLNLDFENSQHSEPEAAIPTSVGFSSASSLMLRSASGSTERIGPEGHTNAEFSTGGALFRTASSKPGFAPSEAALKAAAEKMKQWEREIEDEFSASATQQEEELPSVSVGPSGRVIVGVDENSFLPAHQPESPTLATAGFRRASGASSLSGLPARNQKPFKSPLVAPHTPKEAHISKASTSGYVPSPLNPNRVNEPRLPAVFPSIVSASAMSTPVRPSPPSPKKALGITPRRAGPSNFKAKFVTPFKPGMKPGELGRAQLAQNKTTAQGATNAINKFSASTPQKNRKPSGHSPKTLPLASSGLFPQSHSPRRLKYMGIDIDTLSQVTPETAPYYTFHTKSSAPLTMSQVPAMAVTLGPSSIFDQLKEEGCSLTTLEWVENHWSLILWKLAGMALLDPQREVDPEKKRWCWAEVMKQFRYRYERELNGVARPALRLITTQDAPSASPMVLCVSNIFYNETVERDPSQRTPREIEVTDGWYRLRAEIDAPLSRAIKRGVIRVGRKLAVSGTRVVTDRKDGCEILEAYDSISLRLHGNSCHLATWHAKLGFQKDPFIATLRSLTPDGGPVAVLDLVITKVHDFGFIEYNVDEDGKRISEPPMQMRDELVAREKWKKKREDEASKLRAEYEKEIYRYEGYAERLEWRITKPFCPSEDESPPSQIDDFLLDLEDPAKANATIKRILLPQEAGWLARAVREKCMKDRERMHDEIERDLNDACPSRDVRSFRVIEARDAECERRTAKRQVQLTVWNASTLMLSEDGKPGDFVVGQRFLVTNLWPTHHGAWMNPDEDSFIHLSTRRDTRWTRLH